MPTIRIDHEVWGELQTRGQAFVDTPNDVLRRMLHLDGKPAGMTRRRWPPASKPKSSSPTY